MKKAFTLIELLVVIAIIAILAAILFPVFAQAKAAAKKTQALSNVKQIGTGIQIYLGDSDDVFPQGSGNCWWGPQDGNWIEDTKAYIKSVPILRDPSDPLSKAGWQNWYEGSGIVPVSFASNGYMAWDGSNWSVMGVIGMNQATKGTRCGDGWMGRGVTNATAVTTPADTIALSERFGSFTIFGPGAILTGVDWWDNNGAGGWIPQGDRAATPYTRTMINGASITFNKDQRFGGVTPAYGEKLAVFTFADGHAKAMDPRQTNPVANGPTDSNQTNRSKNMWDAYR